MLELLKLLITPEFADTIEEKLIVTGDGNYGFDELVYEELLEKYPVLKKKFIALNRDGVNNASQFPNFCDNTGTRGIMDELYKRRGFTSDQDVITTTYLDALLEEHKIILPFYFILVPRKRRQPLFIGDIYQELRVPLLPIEYENWSISKSVGRIIFDWMSVATGHEHTLKSEKDSFNINMAESRTAYSPLQVVFNFIEIKEEMLKDLQKTYPGYKLFTHEELVKALGNDNRISLLLKQMADITVEGYGNKKK